MSQVIQLHDRDEQQWKAIVQHRHLSKRSYKPSYLLKKNKVKMTDSSWSKKKKKKKKKYYLPAVQIWQLEWGAHAIPLTQARWLFSRATGVQGTRTSSIITYNERGKTKTKKLMRDFVIKISIKYQYTRIYNFLVFDECFHPEFY